MFIATAQHHQLLPESHQEPAWVREVLPSTVSSNPFKIFIFFSVTGTFLQVDT